MPKIRDYRIVLSENASFNERRAAAFVRRAIRIITGVNIPLVTDRTFPTELEIVIGRTSRETTDGLLFPRNRDAAWEYALFLCRKRLYLTGFGLAPTEAVPYQSAYKVIDDGAYGTAFAAYRFAEEVLGYHELYEAFEQAPENPDLEMPAALSLFHEKKRLLAELPSVPDGPAMISIPSASCPDLNMGCLIFRSRTGQLVVVDGGRAGDTDHVLSVLESLSGGKKPVIAAWLFTHLHSDHYGVYQTLCRNPAQASRVTVQNFYCHLLPEEFYTTLSREPSAALAEPLRDLLASEKTLGVPLHKVEVGQKIVVDDLSFKVLHTPDMAFAKDMNINDSGVVYRLDHESGQRILLLGDAEWVTSNDLTENAADELPAQVVQVGHHGCGNVSKECYRMIGGQVYLFQISDRFWYSERGEGLGTHNTGVIRTRAWLMELGAKRENIYRNSNGIVAFPLPVPVQQGDWQ